MSITESGTKCSLLGSWHRPANQANLEFSRLRTRDIHRAARPCLRRGSGRRRGYPCAHASSTIETKDDISFRSPVRDVPILTMLECERTDYKGAAGGAVDIPAHSQLNQETKDDISFRSPVPDVPILTMLECERTDYNGSGVLRRAWLKVHRPGPRSVIRLPDRCHSSPESSDPLPTRDLHGGRRRKVSPERSLIGHESAAASGSPFRIPTSRQLGHSGQTTASSERQVSGSQRTLRPTWHRTSAPHHATGNWRPVSVIRLFVVRTAAYQGVAVARAAGLADAGGRLMEYSRSFVRSAAARYGSSPPSSEPQPCATSSRIWSSRHRRRT